MKLHLAPMQGMTSAYYRKLYNELFGSIDTYYAPFIATTGKDKIGNPILRNILPENNEGITVIPQLLGNNGVDFRRYAAVLADLGYNEVNWNIGCPYPTVTKKKKGSGILPHPDLIRSLLDEVMKDNRFTVSVKMRLGLRDKSEGIEVMNILNDYPLKSVILHGRVGSQKYEGTVDLDAVEELHKLCAHDFHYNGDIYTVEDFQNIKTRFPTIENFMLGRGALRDPFLPSDIKGQPKENKLALIKDFHDRYFKYHESVLSGDTHLLDRMKGFWTYVAYTVDTDGRFTKKIKKCQTKSSYIITVDRFLDSLEKWSS